MENETEKISKERDISGKRKLETLLEDETELGEDSFYEKLNKLNESSELNLLFMPCLSPQKMGLRKEKYGSDLYLLYKEVTRRGGFYQVMKDDKWDEVESALNLSSSKSMLPAQLQKVYLIHLLPFEQVYWKMTDESNPFADTTLPGPSSFEVAHSCTTEKRKKSESSSHLPCSGTSISPEERKINVDTYNVDKVRRTVDSNKKKKRSLNSIGRDLIEKNDARPMNPRTGHHIFLRLECHRLKMIHGENSGNQNIRKMVLDAWTSLSDEGKQPYIEASKIDRERYEREMEEYNKRRGKNENATCDCSRDDNDP